MDMRPLQKGLSSISAHAAGQSRLGGVAVDYAILSVGEKALLCGGGGS